MGTTFGLETGLEQDRASRTTDTDTDKPGSPCLSPRPCSREPDLPAGW